MATSPESYRKPLPDISGAMAPFWEAARQRRLVIQRCRGCGAYRFPARDVCSQCLSREAEWVDACGEGEVFSFNVMHHVYHPGFAPEVPYAVVLVRLAEGVKMVSNLVDCPPQKIRIGLPVEVVFEEATPEITVPKFRVRR